MFAGLSPPIRDPFVVTVEILRADMLEERPNFHLQADFFPPTAPDSGIVKKVFNLFAHEIPIDAEGEIAWQQAGPLDTGALMKVFNKHLAGVSRPSGDSSL